MRVAIVHYWLVGMRGGEKVLETLLRLYPQADIFTHVFSPQDVSPALAARVKGTTFIQRLPRAQRWYTRYLPLMPLALEQLDLRGYDLVISSESGPAKGVLTGPETLHVCYCHTPMRYLWDKYHDYRAAAGPLTAALMVPLAHYLRLWDLASASRVDAFAANSHNVRRRVEKHYRRACAVVYPPVDVDSLAPCPAHELEDYYLFVGQLVGYKRADLAIAACKGLGRRLVVVGHGEEEARLKAMAGPETTFLGRQDSAALARLYARCRALLFPGEEDFGIVPLEAMASGRPVVALGRGGALETVVDGQTGVLYPEESADGLAQAMLALEARLADFDPAVLRAHAQRFTPQAFLDNFAAFVAAAGRNSPLGQDMAQDQGETPNRP